MRSRSAVRLGSIAAVVLGFASTSVPPAIATEEKLAAFVGTATLSGSVGFPCAATMTRPSVPPLDTDPTKGTKSCPPVPEACPSGVTDCVNKKGKPLETGGNTRSGSLGSTTCVYAGASVWKAPDKSDGLHAGTCVVTATFVVTGYCGLSEGEGRGRITSTEVVGVVRDAHFKFTWVDVGGVWLILGNFWYGTATPPPSGQYEGDVVAVVKVTPVMGGAGNCMTKTARSFLIRGEFALTHPKCLPEHEAPAPACALQ